MFLFEPIIILLGMLTIAVLFVIVIKVVFDKSGRNAPLNAEEEIKFDRLLAGLERMEHRVENLETILQRDHA